MKRTLIFMLLLVSVRCPAPTFPNWFTTNSPSQIQAPDDGWLLGFSNGIPVWTLNGVMLTNLSVPTAQTNWPLSSITNAQNLTNWALLSTNVLADLDQTNWAITDITNSLNLTNWALLSTNALSDIDRTQWAVVDITNAGTAAYSNASAFQLAGTDRTQWSVADVTNAGTAAYSNASAFQLAGTDRTQWAVSDITNAGTAAYSNASAFQLTGTDQTQWPVSAITNAGTAAYSNAAAFLTPAQVGNLAYSNSIKVVNVTDAGTAAYSNAAAFDLAGTATAATNALNTALQITIQNSTNRDQLSVDASNVFSGGQLPIGTVATNTPNSGDFLSFNGSRYWTKDASTLTNVGNISPSLTNWIENLIANQNHNYYFDSLTNSLGVGTSTNCSTMDDAPLLAAQTNSIAVPTAGVYYLSRVATNTITRIEDGPIQLETYVYVTGSGAVSITAHPEIWIWFTNNTMVQLAVGASAVFSKGTQPTIYQTILNVATATNLTGGAHILLRWYADSVTLTPTWNFAIGNGYGSHISVNVGNISFVSSVDVAIPGLVSSGPISTSGTITMTPAGALLTNGESAATVFSNTVAIDAAHALSVSNLTASRVVLTSAADALSSAAASGAVPIDADGSATTAAQVNALAWPGLLLTNGESQATVFSNTVAIDAAHALSVSNLTASRVVLTSAADALSSAAASGAVPIDADGSATTAAQVNALVWPGFILTNGESQATVFSNTVKLDVTHTLSLSNATASHVLQVGADNTVSSVSSGAVPIDGDGTATTKAQIQTLYGGTLTTNNAVLTSGQLQAGDGARGIANTDLTGDVTTAGGVATTIAKVPRVYGGNTSANLVGLNTTVFYGPNGNGYTNFSTSDVSGVTRIESPQAFTSITLYVRFGTAAGSGKTDTVTFLTNGVSTGVTATITGTSALTATGTGTIASLAAGNEIGISINIPSGGTTSKCSWGILLK